MGSARSLSAGMALACALVGCRGDADSATPAPAVAAVVAPVGDSVPEERPDTVRSLPPDSTTMTLALLPPVPATQLTGPAASMADRAVFAPRSQRWFMARALDSVVAMDIGRIDGGVEASTAAQNAFQQMVAARSPIQAGMTFTMHSRSAAVAASVTSFRLSGRRILAVLDRPALDSTERVAPIEWRGSRTVDVREAAPTCSAGDGTAIDAAIARFTATAEESLTVVRGCFGAFRAVIAIRPLEITPESVERVVLVRANGTTRAGRLRDLSYPLHELLSVTDVDGDGTQEIVVRSFRPAMETWAALRMVDSITFARFASGFTIERR